VVTHSDSSGNLVAQIEDLSSWWTSLRAQLLR